VTAKGRKILVVDDEQHSVQRIRTGLERAGYEVITALGGQEALARTALERPDLLVLDAMMPYMDGLEVLDHLRKDPQTRRLPVIMLTLGEQDAATFRGWQASCNAYLVKPVPAAELISCIQRLFAENEGLGA